MAKKVGCSEFVGGPRSCVSREAEGERKKGIIPKVQLTKRELNYNTKKCMRSGLRLIEPP